MSPWFPGPVSLLKGSKTQCCEPTMLESWREASSGTFGPWQGPTGTEVISYLLWMSKSPWELIKKQILLPCPRAALLSQSRVCIFNKRAGWIRCVTRHWRHNCAAVTCHMLGLLPPVSNIILYSLFLSIPGPIKIICFSLSPQQHLFVVKLTSRSLKYKRYIL